MSIPSVLSLLLLLGGFVLLFVDYRVGILVIALATFPIQWAIYQRRQNKIRKLRQLRNDLREEEWVKNRWTSRRGIT